MDSLFVKWVRVFPFPWSEVFCIASLLYTGDDDICLSTGAMMGRNSNLFVSVFTAVIFGFTSNVGAWKVDAHIWIARQVLAEGQRGSIVLDRNGARRTFAIPKTYRRALRNSPEMYLLGSLGPDAFPDVWAGQMVIHPSFAGGWGTSDWLRHLLKTPRELSDDELAFVLGYLSHAAADTFAHTFVNRYAGDLFEIMKHERAAIRHIKLETFVSNHLPPLFDANGATVTPADLVRSGGRIEFPETLVLERLLLNDDAEGQYSAGNAPHLAAAKQLYDNLNDLLAEDGLLRDLERFSVDFAAELYAGIPIDDALIAQLVDYHTKLNAILEDGSQKLKDLALEVSDTVSKLEGVPVDVAERSLDFALDGADQALVLAEKLSVDQLALDAAEKALDLVKDTYDEFQEEVCKEWAVVVFGPAACLAKETVVKHVESAAWKAARQTLAAAESLRNETFKLLRKKNSEAREALKDALDVLRHAQEVHQLARNLIIEIVGETIAGDQLREHFVRWRDSIPVALVEFTRANATAIVNSVDPDKPSILEPLKDWLACYGPVFLSVPVGVMEGACEIYASIGDVRERIDELEESLAKIVGLEKVLELKKKLEAKLAELKDKVFDELLVAGLEEFDRLAGTPTLPLYKALTEDVTAAGLNAEFSSDPSGQGLPVITDVSERVTAEMHVADGKLDPGLFNALYNSITLSKLALLDTSGLQRLASWGGIRSSPYYDGPGLYGDKTVEAENILLGFLRSIDGNHQWQELAPPHPRVSGYDEQDFEQRYLDPDNFGYGYRDDTCTRVRGMRLWVDRTARASLFKQLFHGYVAAGVDMPSALGAGFPGVLSERYPELFDGEDVWGKDALLLKEGEDVAFALRGTGKPGGPLEVRIRGAVVAEAQYSVEGTLDASFSVPAGLLPAHIEVDELGGRRALTFGFSQGCNETGDDATEEASPEVVVEKGDTLWHIAQRLVGDGARYVELFELNSDKIKDPDLIYPGQTFASPWPMPIQLSQVVSTAG